MQVALERIYTTIADKLATDAARVQTPGRSH